MRALEKVRSGNSLEGSIERIVYFNEENGYAVVSIGTSDFDRFTAVGVMPTAKIGLEVALSGEWKVNPKYPKDGPQFVFSSYSIPEPTGEDGVIAFLSSLKGLGESKAKKIVELFGIEALKVLAETPDRLLEVSGIGPRMLGKIKESYQDARGLQDLIMFLHSVGVSAGYAPRIYKAYGVDAVSIVRQNPYILAEEVRGFGFKKADEVALGIGILPGSEVRFDAGIMHCLRGSSNLNGHCFVPHDNLCSMVCDTLTLPDFRPQSVDVARSISRLCSASVKKWQRLVNDDGDIYLFSMHEAEVGLARKLRELSGAIGSPKSLDAWVAGYESENGIQLAKGQRAAIESAASNGVTIVTGGAGTGKTTVSRAVIQQWHEQKKRVRAIAPTGKAAQRIKEATGLESASTIHRALGWSGSGFTHNKDNPLAGDAFLIDEASMVDLKLAWSLFQAIPHHAVVAIVGDINQLPSVGAGNVLRDAIESGSIPVIRLDVVQRQGATSQILQSSLDINKGLFPSLEQVSKLRESRSDALWINCAQDKILEAIEWLVSDRLPSMGFFPDDIQTLAPMHKTDCGNNALNAMIQNAWNPMGRVVPWSKSFRVGDRVIQLKNNYMDNVFNGDIGTIAGFDEESKTVFCRFQDPDNEYRLVSYEPGDLLESLSLAYSISIHKSQGCEFPVVVIPASMQHFMMLQRNLYYTGVTRGKKLVVIVGEEKAIATAVRTEKIGKRNTRLSDRLCE